MTARPMMRYGRRPDPRWFIVVAERNVSSENMQFESSTEVQVFAADESDAMKKVRAEFRFFRLRVAA